MYTNVIYNGINDALPPLMRLLLQKGEENGSRNGAVKELTHVGITLCKPQQREILLPHRKANIAAQIAETMWVLSGRNDIAFLSQYLPRATDYSDDGATWRGAYGPRLRAIGAVNEHEPIDQWDHCLDLLRQDPLTRRAAMTIYDPTIDTEPGKDIPCNNWITFSSRLGKLDMHVGIRSNDLMWGWSGINAFEWSAMLEISAGLLGMQVGSLHFSVTSLHLYAPHWSKGQKIADEMWPHFPDLLPSPAFAPQERSLQEWDALADLWFTAEAAIREGSTFAPTLVRNFPEPMLQSWLQVLQWWWTGDHAYLAPLGGTRLEYATHVSVQPPARGVTVSAGETVVVPGPTVTMPAPQAAQPERASSHSTDAFVGYVTALHNEKHAAYGDSWKRRGEMLGIMANIARKVDRLGGADTSDETSADTALDLAVYLFKYRAWLFDAANGTAWADGTEWVNNRIADTARRVKFMVTDRAAVEQRLRDQFDELENLVMNSQRAEAARLVDMMGTHALVLAQHLWQQSQPQNRTCKFCGGPESSHVPGGSRWTCQSQEGFQPEEPPRTWAQAEEQYLDEKTRRALGVDEYRGADHD